MLNKNVFNRRLNCYRLRHCRRLIDSEFHSRGWVVRRRRRESQRQTVWRPDGEKNEDMFTLYDRIHERHGQTDIAQRHSIVRQKLIQYETINTIY